MPSARYHRLTVPSSATAAAKSFVCGIIRHRCYPIATTTAGASWNSLAITTAARMASSASSSQPQLEQPLKKRSVVSCFIIKYDGGGGGGTTTDEHGKASVALFRRSRMVSTYRHCLAPISGSIDEDDASPLAAAWRELEEETTLAPPQIELLRKGKSYKLSDLSVSREWTIYPFAFRLRSAADAAAIQSDWEHESWGWYDPMLVDDSEAFGGVPRLAESLRRVWFEKDLGLAAGQILARGLGVLKSDHQSGARQLAGKALKVLRDVVEQLVADANSKPEVLDHMLWDTIRIVAWHICKNGRESMGAAITNVVLSALVSLEALMRQGSSARDLFVGELDRRIAQREDANSGSDIAAALATYVEARFGPRLASKKEPISILTLSNSSTIALALQPLITKSGFRIDLRVLESRPLNEGVSLAASIAESVMASAASEEGVTPQKGEEEEGGVDSKVGDGGAKANAIVRRTGTGDGGDDSHSTKSSPESKLSITIYSDASAALAAEGIDLVLIGADRISASGAVSNKTGTLPAILSAKHVAGRRHRSSSALAAGEGDDTESLVVVALGETEKVATPDDPLEEDVVEDNDPAQLVRAWESADLSSGRVRRAAAALLSKVAPSPGSSSSVGGTPAEATAATVVGRGGASESGQTQQQQQQEEEQEEEQRERGEGHTGSTKKTTASVTEDAGDKDGEKEEKEDEGPHPEHAHAHPHHSEVVKVAVKNIFFEWVPPELVDVYICERGVWTVDDIAAHSHALGAEEERLFQDL